MTKDRVGSVCWYQRYVDKRKQVWSPGRLLMWAMDFEEFDGGQSMFPVGIVEDDNDHSVHSVYVERISFNIDCPYH